MNETNQVGQILPTGHKVLANYKNSIILACHQNLEAPEPWVTWHLNGDGERYSGSYFDNQESAERYFAYLCFEWADERTCTPQALAPEEDEEPSEESIKKLLWQQLQLLAKEPPAQDDLPQKSTAMLEIAQDLLKQSIERCGVPNETYIDQPQKNGDALSTLKMNREGLVWLNGSPIDRCISVSVSDINATDTFTATLTVEIDSVDMDYKTLG